VWTWTAICADTKLVCSWTIGDRSGATAREFLGDLAARVSDRFQLTSDAYRAYIGAVDAVFGSDVDYATLEKIYAATSEGAKRYSPGECIGTVTKRVSGNPDPKAINTSYVERQNLTMRMSMRRFTHLTNAFSKKVENLAHAVALHFMYYNFARIHQSLRITPAMAAGVTDRLWEIEDILALAYPRNAEAEAA
jgi:IS1 family transposase